MHIKGQRTFKLHCRRVSMVKHPNGKKIHNAYQISLKREKIFLTDIHVLLTNLVKVTFVVYTVE